MSAIDCTRGSLPITIPNPREGSLWKKSMLAVGKVVLGVLAFSAISAAAGKAMQLGGIRLLPKTGINQSLTTQVANNVGLGLQQAGKGLFLVGKYAFLSVAVPTYTVAYVLPKRIFNEGLPKVVGLTRQYVIIPVYNGVIQVTKFFGERFIKIVQAVYNHALAPIGRVIEKAAVWAWKTAIIPVINKVLQMTIALKGAIVHVAQAIYNHALAPIGRVIEKAAVWAWKAVIIPVINKVLQMTIALKGAIVHVAQAIYNHVLAPIGRVIEKVAVWAWKTAIIPVINKVLQMTIALKGAIVHVAQAIYNHVLAPIGRVIEKAAVWAWKSVIIPVFNGVVQGYEALVVPVAQRVYNYALKPLGQFIGRAFGVAYECSGHVFTAVAGTGNAVINSTYETYLWFTGRG